MASHVWDILMAGGRNRADLALAQAQINADLVRNIGQIPLQVQQQAQQQKRIDALTLLEQAKAAREAGDYAMAQKKQQQADQLHADTQTIAKAALAAGDGRWNSDAALTAAGQTNNPDAIMWTQQRNQEFNPPPKWETVAPGATGGFVTPPSATSPTGGFTSTVTVPPKLEPGTVGDYVQRKRDELKAAGKTEGPNDLLMWTKEFHTATQRPEYEWVRRGDQNVEIIKGTSQPGDVPTTGSGMGALYGDIDPKAIAAQIRAGQHPPDIGQYGRPASAAIASELAKTGPNGEKPFDLAGAQRTWKAQINLNRTMNAAQQVRLDESIRSGLAMYDKIDDLADQWNSKGWGPLSRFNLEAARQGAKGPEAQSLANQLTSQIGQLTSDVATVEQGGLTPTEESRKIAEKSLRDWWSAGTIKDLTAQGRYNMQIRHLARQTQEPMVPGNQPSTAPAQPATPPKMVTLAELAAIAKQRGTTVDQERERYITGGYAVVK